MKYLGYKRILSIIPASGWHSVYRPDDGSTQVFPLVCWALVETDEGDTVVAGLDAGDNYVDYAENMDNFESYWHKSEGK
ncbi:MAG: DUF6253 family protein [Planctomycetota bacterium]|jgi:hypothetical protein